MQNMYPTVDPSIANEEPQNLLRIQFFSIPHATPRHRTRDCQYEGIKKIVNQISKCEQCEQETQDKKFSDSPPQADMTTAPGSAMTPASAPVVAQRRGRIPAAALLASSNQEEAAAPHVAPQQPTEPFPGSFQWMSSSCWCRATSTSRERQVKRETEM